MKTTQTTKTRTTPPPITARMVIESSARHYPEYQSLSYGTDGYTRLNPFTRDLVATDGLVMMCEELGAYWFNDMVASYLHELKKRYHANPDEYFYVCRVSKTEGNAALFTIDDGNEGEPFIKQEIPFTDLEMNLRTYLQTDGQHWIHLCPSEY